MSSGEMTADEVRALIRAKVKQFGSQALLAEHMAITPQYLSDILAGRRDVPTQGAFLDALGLECLIRWKRL